MIYYSQYGQDEWLYSNLFKDKKDGLFLDCGAHDGVTLSNTKFFEDLGWNGICVEPIPNVYAKLAANRNCVTLEGAVWSSRCSKTFTIIDGYSEMLSGISESYNQAHIHRINHEVQTHNQNVQNIEVQCFSINDILYDLTNNGSKTLDFMSIDVEGSEPEILSSLDYSKYKIKVIVCENNYEDISLRNLMKEKGFSFTKRLGVDDVFQNDTIL